MIMMMGQSRSMMRLMMTLEMRVRIVTSMIRLEFPCDYYLCAACDGAPFLQLCPSSFAWALWAASAWAAVACGRRVQTETKRQKWAACEQDDDDDADEDVCLAWACGRGVLWVAFREDKGHLWASSELRGPSFGSLCGRWAAGAEGLRGRSFAAHLQQGGRAGGALWALHGWACV